MPREIDCPDCATDGEIFDEDLSLWVDCQTCDTTGKITVYTQAEINEAVKQEKEECALICDTKLEEHLKDIGYDITQSDPDYYDVGLADGFEKSAEAIRAKGE